MFLYEVHCVVCLNVDGARVPATTMLAAYMVCDLHGELGQWRTNADDTLNLRATIDHLKRIREMYPGPHPTPKGHNV
jgi:hypothetical protein